MDLSADPEIEMLHHIVNIVCDGCRFKERDAGEVIISRTVREGSAARNSLR